jgi:L-asparaginase
MTRRKLVTADNLPPWKARVLLALGLTRTADPDRLQNLFDRV